MRFHSHHYADEERRDALVCAGCRTHRDSKFYGNRISSLAAFKKGIRMSTLATIGKRHQQVALLTPGCETQLLAKFPLHKQHNQNNEHVNNMPVYLEAEGKPAPHATSFQRPPSGQTRGLVALSATCAQGSQTALRKQSLPKPLFERRLFQTTGMSMIVVAAVLLITSTGCFTDIAITVARGKTTDHPPPPPIVPCEQPHHEEHE